MEIAAKLWHAATTKPHGIRQDVVAGIHFPAHVLSRFGQSSIARLRIVFLTVMLEETI